jgi:hypothetical protein
MPLFHSLSLKCQCVGERFSGRTDDRGIGGIRCMTHQRQRHTQACPSDASRPRAKCLTDCQTQIWPSVRKEQTGVSAVDKVTDSHASIVYSAMGLGPMLGRGLIDRHIRAGCMHMWRGPSAGLSRVGQLEPCSWEMGEGGLRAVLTEDGIISNMQQLMMYGWFFWSRFVSLLRERV